MGLDLGRVIIDVVALIIFGGWIALLWRVVRTTRAMPKLSSQDAARFESPPSVTVIFAARNEADAVERTVQTLLAQEDVDIQVIAVDDASSDGTYEILERLAQREERLLVLKNEKLPPGWVAKNYALELGQGRAEGEYLLFTDADVVYAKRALVNALSVMDTQSLDHLAVHPRLEAGSAMEAVVLPLYFLLSETRFIDPRAVDADSGVGAGVGAFNLVKAESYRLRGTHARIRGAVLDDRALGTMMRFDQGRGSIYKSGNQVRMRPYRSWGGMFRGIRKGALSATGNRAILTALASLFLVLAAVGPLLAIVSAATQIAYGMTPYTIPFALVGLLLPAYGLLRVRSLMRFEPLAVVLYPIAGVIIAGCALYAAVVFGLRGQVEWRGRLYSRKTLRSSLEEMR